MKREIGGARLGRRSRTIGFSRWYEEGDRRRVVRLKVKNHRLKRLSKNSTEAFAKKAGAEERPFT